MTASDISAGFLLWAVTTQCVNFVFYLTITRVVRGWWRTIGTYLIYFALLAAVFPLTPLMHGGVRGMAGSLSVTFISFFTLWGVLTMAMSRGVSGRSFFAVVLCGIHQLVAFVVSLLFLRHLECEMLGSALASAVMALMGWFLVSWTWPRVVRMPDKAEWTYLNVIAVALFVLLYAVGIWPVYVVTESSEHLFLFSVAAVVAFAFFPAAMAFTEKSRQASSLAMVEENLRLMSGEMSVRREAVARARQIRNDLRNRCDALAGLLREGKVDAALDYLERLREEADGGRQEDSVWCENETVNAILSGYSRKAAAAGLRFSAMASIAEKGGLPEIEVVEMVSNLLEVAIRTASARGEVSCLLRQRADSFGVTVTSTVSSDFRLTDGGLPIGGSDANVEGAFALARKLHGECRYRIVRGQLTCEALFSVGVPAERVPESASI